MHRYRLHIVTVIAGMIALPSLAFAAPGIPAQFYGTVQNGAGTTASGLTISALINGTVVATTVTQSGGNYGSSPNLLIIPDANGTLAGATITFKVSGIEASQTATFSNASLVHLNLTVPDTTTPTPPPSGGGGNSGGGGGGGGESNTSITTPIVTPASSKADANADGKVDFLDFNSLMVHWGQLGANIIGDFNGDGVVDFLDFNMLMVNWNTI